MAIQLVTGMALNVWDLHNVYERGARGFDVAGYQLMIKQPQYSDMKEIHDTQPKKMHKLLRKNLCILLVECHEPVVNNAQNEQNKF